MHFRILLTVKQREAFLRPPLPQAGEGRVRETARANRRFMFRGGDLPWPLGCSWPLLVGRYLMSGQVNRPYCMQVYDQLQFKDEYGLPNPASSRPDYFTAVPGMAPGCPG